MCESQVWEACDFPMKPSHCKQQVLLETTFSALAVHGRHPSSIKIY